MSLDYSYHIGYGFFVKEADIEGLSGYDEDYSVEDVVHEVLDKIQESYLLKTQQINDMGGPEDLAFVCIKRSVIQGDAKVPVHNSANPAVIDNFESIATVDEISALDAAASALGIEMYIPQSYFYITVS